MRFALPAPVLAVVLALGCLAVAIAQWSASRDERRLESASVALVRGDVEPMRTLPGGRAAAAAGGVRLARGDARGALPDLRRAATLRPNDWRVARDLALALAVTGDRRGARREAARAVRLNPRVLLPPAFRPFVGAS